MPEVSSTNNAHELSMATFMTDAQKRRAERVAEAMAKKVKTTPSTPKTLATVVICSIPSVNTSGLGIGRYD
jgi:hypothetical protein